MKHFIWPFILTFIALVLGGAYGYMQGGVQGALSTVFIVAVLSVLEVALSFDNAVVNAKTLATMEPKWQKRFITWGMPIAVFGMRVIFPLLIVAVAAKIGPVSAFMLALRDPEQYESIISAAHHTIVGFGGSFLFLVGIKYFVDTEKKTHWFKGIEKRLAQAGQLYIVEVIIVLLGLIGTAYFLPVEHQFGFLVAGLFGLITFALVHWLDTFVSYFSAKALAAGASSGLASFIYLEIIDASFSFDGVIGAFALTNSIVIIALGLGVGAIYVRSLTLLLVEKGTLSQYRYLEHGAFWAILGLAFLMFAGLFMHIPEWITGVTGAVLIGASVASSIREKKKA